MTTLKLPADQVLVDGDRIVVVADAEHGLATMRVGAQALSATHPLGPPAWMTAATEPCETCDGDVHRTLPAWADDGCPDCHDGRPILTIKVECGCRQDGWPGMQWTGVYTHDGGKLYSDCPDCDDNGTVTYRLTVSEDYPKVLPVKERHPHAPFGDGEGYVLIISVGQLQVWRNGESKMIDGSPAVTLGQYTLIGEVVR